METKIFIRQVRTHPDTGHITIRLQSETTEGTATWKGKIHDYGIDAHLFYANFSGDIEKLTTYLASEHRAKIGTDPGLADRLAKMVGQQIA